jgi:GT2 family glycosyltransferase
VLDETGGIVAAQLLDRPSPDGAPVQRCGCLDWGGRGISLEDPSEEETETLVHCDWLPGANLMFSAELYRDVGGFDARRFPHYRGDVEFSVRAGRRGYPRVLTSSTWVYNDPGQKSMSFKQRVALRDFIRGFWEYRADYNVRETLRFAFAYCPPRLIPRYLLQFYARWGYFFLKTQWRALRRSVGRQPA